MTHTTRVRNLTASNVDAARQIEHIHAEFGATFVVFDGDPEHVRVIRH